MSGGKCNGEKCNYEGGAGFLAFLMFLMMLFGGPCSTMDRFDEVDQKLDRIERLVNENH